jgi:MFS family permease
MRNKQFYIWLLVAIAMLVINNVFASNGMILGIITLLSIISSCIYLNIVEKASVSKILTALAFLGFFVVYFTTRYTTSAIKDPIQQEFGVNESQLSMFSSNLSLGYGFAQIFSGYLVGRFGSIIITIFALFVSCILIGMSYVTNFNYLCIFRLLLGMFCSAASVGTGSFFSTYWPKRMFIPLYMGATFIAVNAASTVSYVGSKSFSDVFTWKTLLISIGIMGLASVVSQLVFRPSHEKIAEDDEIQDSSDNVVEENDELNWEKIKGVLTDPLIINMFLLSLGTVPLFYILNDGWFKLLSTQANDLSFLLNQGSSYAFMSIPFILYLFSTHNLILFCTISQIVGIALIFFFPGNFYALGTSTVFINIGYLAHILPALWYGKNFRGSVVAFAMGLFNFAAMFFGCFIPQKYMGELVDYLSGTPQEKFLFALKILSIPAIIALFSGIYVYMKLNQIEEEKLKKHNNI